MSAAEIADELKKLAELARRIDQPMLAYLIEIAELEARTSVKPQSIKPTLQP